MRITSPASRVGIPAALCTRLWAAIALLQPCSRAGGRGEAGDVRAPTARRWDPASPARFIEWFLCTCISCSARHAPWCCAALAVAENYADLCTWLMQMRRIATRRSAIAGGVGDPSVNGCEVVEAAALSKALRRGCAARVHELAPSLTRDAHKRCNVVPAATAG